MSFNLNCELVCRAPFSILAGTAAWNRLVHISSQIGFCIYLYSHGFVTYKKASVVFISLAGCPEAAINNIYGATQCAVSHGALGLVVANWTGFAHMTHHCFAWPGFITAAGLAWNSDVRPVSLHHVSVHLHT